MKSSKIFWGLFFILAAVYLIVSKFGLLPDIGIFSIMFTVFLGWMLVEGIRKLNFYEILFSIALFCILYDDELGLTMLSNWTLLGAALFGSIGLSMIFGDFKKKKRMEMYQNATGNNYFDSDAKQCSGEHLRFENNFRAAIRYINSDNFKSARIENNFGKLTVYFDNAMVQENAANISVENNFGETSLYIPKEWQVQNNLNHAFGTINQVGQSVGSSNTVFTVDGEANFGVITIYYI